MSRYTYEEKIKKRYQRAEMRRLANQEKLNRGACVDCGLKVRLGNLVAFDFDHVDRKTKLINIAQIKQNFSPDRLQDELAKCVLRCAVCHRLKTYADRDYMATNNPRLTDTSQPTLFDQTA